MRKYQPIARTLKTIQAVQKNRFNYPQNVSKSYITSFIHQDCDRLLSNVYAHHLQSSFVKLVTGLCKHPLKKRAEKNKRYAFGTQVDLRNNGLVAQEVCQIKQQGALRLATSLSTYADTITEPKPTNTHIYRLIHKHIQVETKSLTPIHKLTHTDTQV